MNRQELEQEISEVATKYGNHAFTVIGPTKERNLSIEDVRDLRQAGAVLIITINKEKNE